MKCRSAYHFLLFILLTGMLMIPAVSAFPIPPSIFDGLENALLHMQAPQHKWRQVSDDYLKQGDTCREKCQIYSGRLRNRFLDLYKNDASIISRESVRSDRPVPNENTYLATDSDAMFYANTRDYWCTCALDNYNMAIETSPGNDFSHQSVLYQRAALVYGAVGNTAEQQRATDKAEALAEAHSTWKLPLPPWVTILGLITMFLYIHGKKRGKQ